MIDRNRQDRPRKKEAVEAYISTLFDTHADLNGDKMIVGPHCVTSFAERESQ